MRQYILPVTPSCGVCRKNRHTIRGRNFACLGKEAVCAQAGLLAHLGYVGHSKDRVVLRLARKAY
jgi:hypothetical protein